MIIQLSRAHHKTVWININTISSYETIEDTHANTQVTLTNGNHFNVTEGPDEVTHKIVQVMPLIP